MPTGNGQPRVYSIATDFPTGDYNPNQLRTQIEADPSITTTLPAAGWSEQKGDFFSIFFDAVLTAPEIVALDAVVAAHVPVVTTVEFQFKESAAVQSTSLEAYQVAHTLNAKPMLEGTYILTWYYELRVVPVGGLNSNAQARFRIDGNAKGHHCIQSLEWHSVSGWDRIRPDEGDTPQLTIEFRREPGVGGNDTIQIRRMKLGLERKDNLIDA